MRKIVTLCFTLFLMFSTLSAQESNVTEILISQNKLTAVNVVLLVILVGILIYLVIQDRKIKKLEDRFND